MLKLKRHWTRNSDHILVCEHENPLHDDCLLCEMQDEYRSNNVVVLVALAIIVGMLCAAVYFALGGSA